MLGLFGLCIDGGWVPSGHPLATDYLGRSLVTDYSGIYTLTLIADDCTAEVPDVLKRRVYTARIEQIGAILHVFLSGADFPPGSNSFTGVVVSTDEIRFDIFSLIDFYYGSFFEVGEKIAGVGTLVVDGIFHVNTSIIDSTYEQRIVRKRGNHLSRRRLLLRRRRLGVFHQQL